MSTNERIDRRGALALAERVVSIDVAPLNGRDVLDELLELLDRRLPDLPADDPCREHLMRFRAAAAPLGMALRALAPVR